MSAVMAASICVCEPKRLFLSVPRAHTADCNTPGYREALIDGLAFTAF